MTNNSKQESHHPGSVSGRIHIRVAGIWEILLDATENFRDNGDVNQAAAIALYAILSIIPLFILALIAASQFFSSNPDIQNQIIEGIRGFHPSLENLLTQLGQIEQKKKVLGWVGIISLIWLSAMIFSSIETSLNVIFRSQIRRNYVISKLLAIAMIPIGLTIATLSIAFTYLSTILARLPAFTEKGFWVFALARGATFRYFLPYLLTVAFFTIVYKLIPTRKVRLTNAIAGSAIFSALMEVAKQFFSWYISNYTRYNVIFGSLETVVILVMWVFYIALILLFCAELISSYQRRDLILLEKALLKPRKNIFKIDERLFRKFGRVYPEGDYIFREGDTDREMYYILAGNVRLEKKAGQVKKVLAEMGPGEYFGEMAALIDVPRTASAYATEDSNVAVINGDTFRSLLHDSGDVSLFMLKEFSNRIIRTNLSLEELTQAWIKLIVILYFLKEWPLRDNQDPLLELAQYTGKEEGEILEILTELSKRRVLTLKGNLVTGFFKEKAWHLWTDHMLR